MLNNLEIQNGSMNPTFDSNIYNYEVSVDDTVISLIMDYEVNDNNKVVVYGNDNLVNGENHVLIEIYDGQKVYTYNLTVYKGIVNSITEDKMLTKIEVTGQKQDNQFVKVSIIIIMIITIVLLYKMIFNKAK